MLKNLPLFIILGALTFSANAQKFGALFGRENNCADMLAISDAEHLVICDSAKSNRKDKELDDDYSMLKKSILEALSQRISVSVKSTSTSNIKSNDVKVTHEEFTFESTVTSSNKLVEIEWEYCISKSRKMIYARCKMNRKNAANAIINSCVAALKVLNSELNAIIEQKSVARSETFEKEFSAIKHDHNSAVFIFPSLTSAEWENTLHKYYDLLTELKNSEAGGELSQRIEQANRFATNEKFPEAIRSYRSILQNQQLKDVRVLLEETEKKYYEYTKRESEIQTQIDNHVGAISNWKSFIQLSAYPEALIQLKECEGRRFLQLEREFKSAIQRNDDELIESQLLELKSLNSCYPDKFKTLEKVHKTYRIQKNEELIRIKLRLKKTEEALNITIATGTEFGYNARLEQLKSEIESKLVKEEIRREKKTRPMLNTFELGVDAFFQETINNNEIFSVENNIYPGISGGLYFRYKIKNSPIFPGKTRADILGVQARLVDLGNFASHQSQDSLVSPATAGIFLFEIGPDVTFWRVFRANVNVVYKDRVLIEKPVGMSFTFGFLLPLGRLSLGANARCFSDPQYNLRYNINGYMRCRLDFNRKYSSTDKKAAKHRILN